MTANEIQNNNIDISNLHSNNRINNQSFLFFQTSNMEYPTLLDSDFGIKTNAAALKRSVEYCQWIEDGFDSMDGKTRTRRYFKTWFKSKINSSEFMDLRYQNPITQFPLSDSIIYSDEVSFNDYLIDKSLFIDNNDNFNVFNPNENSYLKTFDSRFQYVGKGKFYLPYNASEFSKTKKDIDDCTPGDILVSYYQYSPSILSVIGTIDNSTNIINQKTINGFDFGNAHSGLIAPRDIILKRYSYLWKYFIISKFIMFILTLCFVYLFAPTYKHRICSFIILAVVNMTIRSYIWNFKYLNPKFWTCTLITISSLCALFRNIIFAN